MSNFAEGDGVAVVSLLFFHSDIEWHVFGTALLFAYCSCVIARLCACPARAIPALLVAAVPVIVLVRFGTNFRAV